MYRWILAAGLVFCLALFAPGTALARGVKPCGTERVARGALARVAVAGVDCDRGLGVARDIYRQIASGKMPKRRDHYLADGFSCQAVLAQTELTCKSADRWILASTQPTDHPGEWQVPGRRQPR